MIHQVPAGRHPRILVMKNSFTTDAHGHPTRPGATLSLMVALFSIANTEVLVEMQAAGVVPSNCTLSILLKLLGHACRFNQAFAMVDGSTFKDGFRSNVQVHTCLAQTCIMNRRLERAMHLFDTMDPTGWRN